LSSRHFQRIAPENALRTLIPLTLVLATSNPASGSFTTFKVKSQWEAAAGPYDTMTFADVGEEWTFLSDQYVDKGVLFTDGDDHTWMSASLFVNDGWGVRDNPGLDLGFIEFTFLEPQHWISAEFAGALRFELYMNEELVAMHEFNDAGVGNFAGIVSTEAFNKVKLRDHFDGVIYVDDIHFGTIPTPATPAFLIGGLLAMHSRQRKGGAA
jgi:hypothetical protein